MKLPSFPLFLSGGFVAYVVLAVLSSKFLEQQPPRFIEGFISIFAAPLFFIFRPLYPLLKPFGLLEGEYWQGPSWLGLILCTLLYAGILFLVALYLSRLLAGSSLKGNL